MNDGMNAKTAQSDDWETPDWLIKALDSEFGLNYDAAADVRNAKFRSWTNDIDTAAADMEPEWRIFCNPPYSNIEFFVDHLLRLHNFSVMLLPVRTDTNWFRSLAESSRVTLRFFRKRIEFCLDSKPAGSPRFASMLAIIQQVSP